METPLTWLLESAEVSDERMNLYFDQFVPLCNFLLECLLPGCRWCTPLGGSGRGFCPKAEMERQETEGPAVMQPDCSAGILGSHPWDLSWLQKARADDSTKGKGLEVPLRPNTP